MGENHDGGVPAAGRPSGLTRRRMLGAYGAAGLAVVGAAGCRAEGSTRDGGAGTEGKSAKGGRGALEAEDAARVTAPPPEGVLGANFNGDPSRLEFGELEDITATWLRGFFPMPDADDGPIAAKPQIEWLLRARERGYGTVLSLKFPYRNKPLPTPGTAAWVTAFKRLDRVLPVVMDKVDILVTGNEPFLETQGKERDSRLNVFYEALAKHVVAYRDKHSADGTKLYMGALNNLDREGGQTEATERWLKFVRKNGDIDGVDIHPHLENPGGSREFLEYVLSRMRPEQKFLATEFSLVHLWENHLKYPVSAEFADLYPKERGKKVWQVIRESTRHRFTQQKWDDFLSMSPWFEENNGYLREQVEEFRGTGRLAVASYGVSQDEAMATNFTEKSVPWLLNSLFCPYTVQPGKDGLPGRNNVWIREFRALQKR